MNRKIYSFLQGGDAPATVNKATTDILALLHKRNFGISQEENSSIINVSTANGETQLATITLDTSETTPAIVVEYTDRCGNNRDTQKLERTLHNMVSKHKGREISVREAG